MDAHIITAHKDEATGEYYAVTTWHTDDCPAYVVERILLEDGVRQAKEKSERTQQEFVAAYERLIRAVARSHVSESAVPFVEALVELTEAQVEDLGRFVTPERWAEILGKHFPPDAGPVRPDEEEAR